MSDTLKSQIPQAVLDQVSGKGVVETGFATGPGFCAGKVDKHSPPISLDEGLAWMEKYREHLKGGCVVFEDESALWFQWSQFERYLSEPLKKRPRPGVMQIQKRRLNKK